MFSKSSSVLLSAAALAMPLAAANAAQGAITVLQSLANGSYSGLTVSNTGTIYGVTTFGGPYGYSGGTVFSMNASGGGYTTLANLDSATTGEHPVTPLLSGNTLYLVTEGGGAKAGSGNYAGGTVLSLPVTGGTPTVLYGFSGAPDGGAPLTGVAESSGTLYGATFLGGANSAGTLYSVPAGGGSDTIIHSFGGASPDGSQPYVGTPILVGSTLYGTTRYGGADGAGAIYSYDIASQTFNTVYSFQSGANGAFADGPVTESGGKLFGMLLNGGNSTDDGLIYSVNSDGTGFQVLHDFSGGATDGLNPGAGLVLVGNTLYGTTAAGGANNDGVIFSVNTDGTNYQILDSFNGTDGADPQTGLSLFGSNLYGMTRGGGTNSNGVVYSIPVPEPATLGLLGACGLGLLLLKRRKTA